MTKTPDSDNAVKSGKRRVGFWRWVWRITAGTFAVLVVILALFIGLFRVAVPLFPDYQQRIESAATRALGYPITVGGIDARWRLRGPELVFDDVTVRTTDNQRELFKAERLRVALDAMALVRTGEIKPSSMTLTGSEVNLHRTSDGVWYVQGLSLDSLRSDEPVAAPWGVEDGLFGVQNLSLTIIDDLKGTSVTVPDIDTDFNVQNTVLSVVGELELERRGARIKFSADANGRADQFNQIVWTGFIAGQRINFTQLAAALPEQLHWSTEEPFSTSVWFRAVGLQAQEANITVDARDVNVSDVDKTVGRVKGQFKWAGDKERWQLEGENVDISSADDSIEGTLRVGRTTITLPVADTDIVPSDTDAGNSAAKTEVSKVQYSLSATELNLEELGVLATPLSDSIRTFIDDLAPKGRIRDLKGSVALEDKSLVDFEVDATLTGIGYNPAEGRPSIQGVDARIFGSRDEGGLELTNARQLILPGVLREPVEVGSMTALLNWTHEDDGARIEATQISFQNDDIAFGGTVAVSRKTVEDAWFGEIELGVERLDLVNAKQYFPVNRFSGNLLKWLDNALTAGTGSEGSFSLEGPLNKFPYADPDDGKFLASIKLNDATLHYANNYPDATDLDATIVFERNSLRGTVEQARILTLPIENAQASIDDLKKSIVFIEGSLTAPLDDMRAFLDATPLVANWGQGWPDAHFFGDGTAQLSLTIPTKERSNTQFDVALQFNNSSFQFRDWRQTMTELRGELRATRAGLSGSGIRGRFLGEPVELAVTPSATNGYTSDLFLKGTAVPSSLSRHVNEVLADHLSGAADWTASLSLPRAGTQAPLQVRMRSPLKGMAVTLPAPLAKTAQETRFADALLTVGDERSLSLRIDYGDDTNMLANVRNDNGYWTVPRGEMRFGGGAASLPDTDRVRVMGSVATLDLSEIVEFTQRYSPERPWIEFNEAQLSVAALAGLGQEFGATQVEMLHETSGYVLNFLGDRVSGELQVPQNITPETPVQGQFETLQWASTDSKDPVDPSDAPSIRALVDNFKFNDYDLGALVMHLEARENLVAVREFTTTTPDFNTRTTGSWVFGNEESTTYLVSEFTASNVKNTLNSLGQAEFLEASEATGRIEMTWPGGWTPDYLKTMEGELSVSIGQGKLVSVDPGAGRVFGLLSVGALPRRLNLDFRDVFDSGFGFDSISGDFVIRDGNAVTENLALSGPAANVVIVGRTGLIDKDYDQTALVYANFGSSLPIAGAIAGGPAVGAALLVVTEIFKKPLQNMGKVSYSITGGWNEPVVARTGSARPVAQAPADSEAAEDSPVEAEGQGAETDTETTAPEITIPEAIGQ